MYAVLVYYRKYFLNFLSHSSYLFVFVPVFGFLCLLTLLIVVLCVRNGFNGGVLYCVSLAGYLHNHSTKKVFPFPPQSAHVLNKYPSWFGTFDTGTFVNGTRAEVDGQGRVPKVPHQKYLVWWKNTLIAHSNKHTHTRLSRD